MNFKTLRDTEERKILKEIITFFYISNKKILYLFQLILEDNSILKKMFIPLITQYMHFYVYIFLFFFFYQDMHPTSIAMYIQFFFTLKDEADGIRSYHF